MVFYIGYQRKPHMQLKAEICGANHIDYLEERSHPDRGGRASPKPMRQEHSCVEKIVRRQMYVLGDDRHMGGQALRAEECPDLIYVLKNHSDFCTENREYRMEAVSLIRTLQ